MLRKRKEPKAKKSIAEALLRDMQGTAAQKLALFEKLRGAGRICGGRPRGASQGREHAADVCGDGEREGVMGGARRTTAPAYFAVALHRLGTVAQQPLTIEKLLTERMGDCGLRRGRRQPLAYSLKARQRQVPGAVLGPDRRHT